MRILCRDAEWLVTRTESSDKSGRFQAVYCVGADDLVRGQQRVFLEQRDEMVPVDPRATELVPDESSGYLLSRLFLEAQLRQMPATSIDPDFSNMGTFVPMEYQREAVHRALLQLRPRLLLADAVGLGKTIEVGMILAEMMRRSRADRILVLAKKSMLTQFQSELWNRFGIPLVRLDSEGIAKLRLRIPANKNPFEVYQRIIVSIDTLKDVGRYRHFLEETRWDVVVIDEAHNVAGASVPERHLSHRLARLLSRRTDSMLLTTATPHNGKRETFGRLISLLDPSAIPDPLLRDYEAEDIRDFFLMRFKEDVREEAGENFREREVVPHERTSESASETEEAVFSILADMRSHNDSDVPSGERIDSLMQYGLYKLFLSSPEACRKTTAKRMSKLAREAPDHPSLPYLQRIEESLSGQSLAQSTRYRVLKRQLEELSWNGGGHSPRVLIFTEYRETQNALIEALTRDFGLRHSDDFAKQAGEPIAAIHGGVPDVHLMKIVESFATGSSPMRMLIATDVASEGINLHHECHNVIHYDLPWSIITLIQRNGRVDRFGQRQTPCLRYLMVDSTQDVFAGDRDIFERLIEKVEEINRSTRSGESVLKLYDPEAEERYIANNGILAANGGVIEDAEADPEEGEASEIEALLRLANDEGTDEYRKFLLGEDGDPSTPAEAPPPLGEPDAPPQTLFSDREFLLHGYRYLAQHESGYPKLREDEDIIHLHAPEDLARRLGAPHLHGNSIHGATTIPSEAWPEDDEFRFTDDLDRANTAIQAARNTSGYWARTQLLMERHPVLQWVSERLMMFMERNQAPRIFSRHLAPGELCFCFIGQVSSKAGTPLVVDSHAVSYCRDGNFRCLPLHQALENAQLGNLENRADRLPSKATPPLIQAAVEQSLDHLRTLRIERDRRMAPLLRKESRRLRNWQKRRIAELEKRIAEGDTRSQRWHQEIEDINLYVDDRETNWQRTYFDANAKPSTRLVLVMEGVDA